MSNNNVTGVSGLGPSVYGKSDPHSISSKSNISGGPGSAGPANRANNLAGKTPNTAPLSPPAPAKPSGLVEQPHQPFGVPQGGANAAFASALPQPNLAAGPPRLPKPPMPVPGWLQRNQYSNAYMAPKAAPQPQPEPPKPAPAPAQPAARPPISDPDPVAFRKARAARRAKDREAEAARRASRTPEQVKQEAYDAERARKSEYAAANKRIHARRARDAARRGLITQSAAQRAQARRNRLAMRKYSVDKAALTPFAKAFIERCESNGMDDYQTLVAATKAAAYHPAAERELAGFLKSANAFGAIPKIWGGAKQLTKNAPAMLDEAADMTSGAWTGAKNTMKGVSDWFSPKPPKLQVDLPKTLKPLDVPTGSTAPRTSPVPRPDTLTPKAAPGAPHPGAGAIPKATAAAGAAAAVPAVGYGIGAGIDKGVQSAKGVVHDTAQQMGQEIGDDLIELYSDRLASMMPEEAGAQGGELMADFKAGMMGDPEAAARVKARNSSTLKTVMQATGAETPEEAVGIAAKLIQAYQEGNVWELLKHGWGQLSEGQQWAIMTGGGLLISSILSAMGGNTGLGLGLGALGSIAMAGGLGLFDGVPEMLNDWMQSDTPAPANAATVNQPAAQPAPSSVPPQPTSQPAPFEGRNEYATQTQ